MTETRYVGVKEEATFGTEAAVPMAYDLTEGMASCSLDAPKDPNIDVPTLSRFQGKHIPGFYSPEGDLEYTIDINTIGWFLKWTLGGYKFTAGTTAPNTHEFWGTLGYTLPSFTTRVGKDNFEHTFIGCQSNKLVINIEDALATLKNSIVSQQDKKDTIRTTLNEVDTDIYPLAFYNVTNNIGGVDVSSDTQKYEFSYDNGIKAEDGQGLGSRFPYQFRTTGASVEIGITKRDNSSALLEAFWGSATGPTSTPGTNFAVETIFNSGSFGSMNIKAPSCYYKEVPTDIKGSDPRTPDLSVGVEASEITLLDGTTTVTSPILITLENYEDEYKLPG